MSSCCMRSLCVQPVSRPGVWLVLCLFLRVANSAGQVLDVSS